MGYLELKNEDAEIVLQVETFENSVELEAVQHGALFDVIPVSLNEEQVEALVNLLGAWLGKKLT